MADKRTHYLVLCRDNGEIVEQYDIGGTDEWDLSKSMARAALIQEIVADVERTMPVDGKEVD